VELYSDTEQYSKRIVAYAVNNPDQNIAVIAPNRDIKSSFCYQIAQNGGNTEQYIDAKETPDFNPDSEKVKVFTYKTHKGLEFDAVFMPELNDKFFSNETAIKSNQFMVAITRARKRLFLGTDTYDESESFVLRKIRSNGDLVELDKISNITDRSESSMDSSNQDLGTNNHFDDDIPF